MSGDRPYQQADLDWMKKRLKKVSQDCLEEATLVSDELQYRSTSAAKSMREQIARFRESLASFIRAR